MLHRFSWRALCALVVLGIPFTVQAANKTWTAAVSGDFADPARWTGGVPGAADTATFNAAGTYTVTFDKTPNPLTPPVDNQDLFFQAGNVTFTSGVDGTYTYRLTGAGGDDANITGGSLSLGTSGNPLHMTVDDDLVVRGGSTLNLRFGSQVNALDLLLANAIAGGNGTIVVDGTNSRLDVTNGFNLVQNGNTGTLTYRNSAQGTLGGTVNLAFSGNAATVAFLNVESSAALTTGSLNVGNGSAAATGTLNINGAGSTLTQSAASTINVGTAAAGIGNINIGTSASGATLTTSTDGTMTINARGTVNIGSGANTGTFNANGDVTINGGTLTRGSDSNFALAPGKTMTVQNGGSASFTGSYTTASNAIYNVTGATSMLETVGSSGILAINDGAQVNVTSGGSVSSARSIDVAVGGSGTLVVDGAGSSVTAGGFSSIWGGLGTTATVEFRNNATGTFNGGLGLATNDNPGTTADVNILSGAHLTVGFLTLVQQGGATTSASLDVQGSGSTVTQTGSNLIAVGHSSTGTATINIGTTASGPVFSTSTGGLLFIRATGRVNIGSSSGASTGTLNANGDVTIEGGTLTRGSGSNFVLAPSKRMAIQNGGAATFTGDYSTATDAIYNIDGTNSKLETLSGGAFNLSNGAQVNVTANGLLSIDGNTTVGNASNGTLSLQGSNARATVSDANSLTVGHATTGTATVNIGTTASGATLTTGTDGTTTINATGTVNIGSGANTGTLNANGDVTIDGGTLTRGNGSAFVLAPGKTMTVQNGGLASFTGSYTTASNAIYNVTGSGSELKTLSSSLSTNNGAQVNVSNQGLLEASNSLIGTVGNGTLSVDGAGTVASASAVSIWGTNGNVATVEFSNGASGTFNTLLLANSSVDGTTANVDILSGASLNLSGGLQLGVPFGVNTTATLDIQGSGSSVIQSNSNIVSVTVGHASFGAGTATNTINIGTTASGAVFTTGTGLFIINATGTVNIGSGANTGSLNANGNVTINGGTLTRNNGVFNLAAGRTLTAQNNAQVNLGFDGLLTGGNTWNFNSGADLTSTGPINIGVSDGTTIVTVDGIGSSMTTGNATSTWGRLGHTAIVTIRNNATAAIGDLDIARVGGTGGTSGTLNVQSGAQVTVGNLRVADLEIAPGITFFGTVNVMGIGSTLTLSPASVLRLGQDLESTGAATLNVTDGGTVTVGSSTTLNNTGTINIDGGTVDLKTLNGIGGTINFIAGSLSYIGNLTVGTGGLLGTNLTLDSGRELTLSGTTTIDVGRALTLDGGKLSTGSLVVNGAFHFDRGTLELTAGTISGLGNLAVGTNAEFRAGGVQSLQIIGLTASTIRAIDDLTLGDSTKVNGFYSNGTVDVGAHTVTLHDANAAVFDSAALVTLGDGGSPGTLAASNGLTLDFGGNVTGFGTVNTPDNIATPLINNGDIKGNSGAQPITLSGYVKGVGTLDNVVITGTDAPGFSPATVVRGSVVYDGTLEIEIGGTAPGSFDQIHHILGAGTAQLGGELDVALINGFNPVFNDSFEIITATGGVNGTFTTLADELPALSAGLEWAIDYGANNVVLQVVAAGLPGDYNANGIVDAADYVLWRNTLGQTGTGLPADGNNNNQIDPGDYIVWRAHFGQTVGGGAGSHSTHLTSTVPEPNCLLLLGAGVIVLTVAARGRRHSSQV